ncbi:MAG: purine nucleoside permease [Acidobacteriaceae bacterium]|nr:purine nucleoside permease [Acidobacteriaceae bacterium]
MPLRRTLLAFAALTAALLALPAQAQKKPWPIRAVIVTTYEPGNDTGDQPGEFQFWVEREHLDEVIDWPGGPRAIRANHDHTVLGIVSGINLVNSTASLMALGLDPRFDLTHAYFIINGIAGIDPNAGSVGSAAWARYVVGDFIRYLDPRDAPKDWPYGWFPMGALKPNPDVIPESPTTRRSNLYTLNIPFVNWAYQQTKDLKIADDPKVADFRKAFKEYPNADHTPVVMEGDDFASDFFWHGAESNKFAEDWVKLWTKGKGTFVMTNTEDSGFMNAVERLGHMHRIDPNRVLVLRTASNFTIPRPGEPAVSSLTAPFIGGRMAFESAYLCGSTVLHKLLDNWKTTYSTVPSAK